MFNDIPPRVLATMAQLEQRDRADRANGTTRLERLRQITPDTGRFIALWAAGSVSGDVIEIGTSAGYSTLWLALACRATARTLRTFEILPEKARLARETFNSAGVGDVVELVEGDFLDHAHAIDDIGFCFLDAEKEVYRACYDVVVPKMTPGAVLIADNATSHADDLQTMLDFALADPRVDAMVATVGKGELVCRKR